MSPDSRWLIAWGQASRLFDLRAENPAAAVTILDDTETGTDSAGFTPSGRWAVCVGRLNIKRFDLSAANPVAASIILGDTTEQSIDREITIRDAVEVESGEELRPRAERHDAHAQTPRVSHDWRWLALSKSDVQPELFNLETEDPKQSPFLLAGFSRPIKELVVSPSNQWAVSTSFGFEDTPASTAYLWRLSSAPEAVPFELIHPEAVRSMRFSKDGKSLMTSSVDGTIRVWDLTSEDPSKSSLPRLHFDGHVSAIASSPDGRWLATGSDSVSHLRTESFVRLYDMQGYGRAELVIASNSIGEMSFSSDSQWLFASSSNEAYVWNLRELRDINEGDRFRLPKLTTETIVLRGHDGPIQAAEFTSDGRWLVTAGDSIRLWPLTGRRSATALPVTVTAGLGKIWRVDVSPDSRWVAATTSEAETWLWDRTSESPRRRLQPIALGDPMTQSLVIFSPDSRRLAVATHVRRARWDLRLYALTPSAIDAPPRLLEGHTAPVTAMAFTPDSRFLVTASEDKTLRLWNLASMSSMPLRNGGKTVDIRMSSNGRRMVTLDEDASSVYLWTLGRDGVPRAPSELQGHREPIVTIEISPDAQWLATSSGDETARLWDLTSRDPHASPRVFPHGRPNEPVVFSPNGRWIVTLRSVGKRLSPEERTDVMLWDLSAPDPPKPAILNGDLYVERRFSPDSRSLATLTRDPRVPGSPVVVSLWNLTKSPLPRKPVITFLEPAQPMEFSADGRWLLTGNRKWDLRSDDITASVVRLPLLEEGEIGAVAMAPDASTAMIAVGRHLSFYPLRLDDVFAAAVRAAGRNLTPAEWRPLVPHEAYRKSLPQLP